MSQRDLAQAVGKTTGWVSLVERGEIPLDKASVATALARLFGISPLELLPELVAPQREAWPEAEQLMLMLASIPGAVTFFGGAKAISVPTLYEAGQQVQRIRQLLRAHDIRPMVPELLRLIPLIGAAEHSRPNGEWTILRTELYHLAALALAEMGEPAAAWVAMDRGIFLTRNPRDYLDYSLSMILNLAQLHAQLGRSDWAVVTARNVIRSGQPILDLPSPPIAHLIIAGAARTLLATWESSRGQDKPAEVALVEAQHLVELLPAGEHRIHGYTFGPVSLQLARITVATNEDRWADAAALVAQLEPTVLATDTERASLAVQSALVHLGLGDRRSAVIDLVRAEQADAYEASTTPPARRALTWLAATAKRNSPLPPAIRDLINRLGATLA